MRKVICLLLTLSVLFVCGLVRAETVRVVYKLDDSVAVIYYALGSKLARVEAFDRIMEEAGFGGLEYEDIDSSKLPTREDRNAWTKKIGGGVKVDQAKAQQLRESKKR